MKTSIILFLFLSLSFPNDSNPFEKFIKIIPPNWSYEINNGLLIITKKDSIEFTYCQDMSPLNRPEPVRKEPYIITIEAVEKLSNSEIKRRQFLQDSILAEYQKNHNLQGDKISYHKLHWFKENKNDIDTLRIPFHSHKKYSYYIKFNTPVSICNLNISVRDEIMNFNEMIYNIK